MDGCGPRNTRNTRKNLNRRERRERRAEDGRKKAQKRTRILSQSPRSADTEAAGDGRREGTERGHGGSRRRAKEGRGTEDGGGFLPQKSRSSDTESEGDGGRRADGGWARRAEPSALNPEVLTFPLFPPFTYTFPFPFHFFVPRLRPVASEPRSNRTFPAITAPAHSPSRASKPSEQRVKPTRLCRASSGAFLSAYAALWPRARALRAAFSQSPASGPLRRSIGAAAAR